MTTGPIVPLTLEHAALMASAPKDMIERAKARHAFPWWDSDDPYVIFPAQLREPLLLIPYDRFKDAAELVLGRSVLDFECLNRARLLAEYEELKAVAS